jgi:molybdenum cofactor cytidylyltransferase
LVHGIVLAGGKSSRMKQNKMLLEFNGKPLIYHTVKSMITYCNVITIVSGFYRVDYKKILSEFENIQVVHNFDYELGMFSSVKMAIKDVHSDCFIIPGDYPLVKPQTYQKLLDEKGEIKVPVFKDYKGHPLFISHKLVEDLKNESIDSNLKLWRDKHKLTLVQVEDSGVVRDIDTIIEYESLKNQERIDDVED